MNFPELVNRIFAWVLETSWQASVLVLRSLRLTDVWMGRSTAAYALWKLNHEPDEVVPALNRVLEDNIHMAQAMDVLDEIGPDAKAAIPVLQICLKSKRSGDHAAAALAKIDPERFGKESSL